MDKSYKKPLLLITFGVLPQAWGDLICGIQQSKLCCQLSKIVYWLARSDFIRPFAGLCSECTRARTGKEASTKAD